jgi:hypothetical protein
VNLIQCADERGDTSDNIQRSVYAMLCFLFPAGFVRLRLITVRYLCHLSRSYCSVDIILLVNIMQRHETFDIKKIAGFQFTE